MSTAIAKNFQIGADSTATNNFTIFQPATPDGTLRIGNGNTGITTGLVTLNSSGNLGLGVTPSASSVSGIIEGGYGTFGQTTALGTSIAGNAYYNSGWKYKISSTLATLQLQDSGGFKWNIAASGTAGNAITFTQAMTLDASGNLLVGKSATNVANAGWELSPNGGALTVTITGSNQAFVYNNTATSGTATIAFRTANVEKGYIAWTNTATSYNTSSDYRLKENVQPMTGALAKVAALKPVTYTWKTDGSAGEGFIAHELAEVCPAAVTGEKDAVDAEGNPVYQGIDTSFLVATLTAALQETHALIKEQQTKIESLTTRIAALEGV